MGRRRILLKAALASTLVVGGAGCLAFLALDWCGARPPEGPRLERMEVAQGALFAGAAKVELVPPFPVVVAGYGPRRPEAMRARFPLYARAMVLRVGEVKVGLVVVDLLLVPATLAARVSEGTASLGLNEVWVVATHSHSSMGGYDDGLLSQVAATGRFRSGASDAVVSAAVKALGEAAAALQPAALSQEETVVAGLTRARSGTGLDERLSRLALRGNRGAIGQLILFSAHPTLVERKTAELDPDWPGALARLQEIEGGVTLVVQGAVGNASVADSAGGPEGFAARVGGKFGRVQSGLEPDSAATNLGYARVAVTLPRPDSSRLVGLPPALRTAGRNVLCGSAPATAELSMLRLGPVALVGLPLEPSFAAARSLEAAGGASRTVSLVNGYWGYVEPPEVVEGLGGESRRQYFDSSLEVVLGRGAALAGRSLGLVR